MSGWAAGGECADDYLKPQVEACNEKVAQAVRAIHRIVAQPIQGTALQSHTNTPRVGRALAACTQGFSYRSLFCYFCCQLRLLLKRERTL